MAHSNRGAKKLVRLQKKRALKAARVAKYEAFRKLGINTKSKRAKVKRKKTMNSTSHPDGACGNIGCIKCNPNTAFTIEEKRKKINSTKVK